MWFCSVERGGECVARRGLLLGTATPRHATHSRHRGQVVTCSLRPTVREGHWPRHQKREKKKDNPSEVPVSASPVVAETDCINEHLARDQLTHC
ncbi:hypothetical protein E2C01_078683 [Portunus trituberculatus]|uniref:Uncharacterized protein n=1 Tax=Portunus trituberculatus TaxID=210409 RepID=A0A5B7IHI8_PORTR|nr:hypothetical protein [Portunus trituberculatus]